MASSSPKVGILLHLPHAAGRLYANVSRGFRSTDVGVIADPTLPFITEWAYETGAASRAPADLNATMALFRTPTSATSRASTRSRCPRPAEARAGGRGVELGLQAQVTPGLSVSGDFTAVDAKYKSLITEEGDTLSGTRIFNTARFVGSFAVAVGATQFVLEFQGQLQPGGTLHAVR